MNKIEEIYTEIQSFYTPMGIEKEIYIMSNLEDMDFNNIELHLSMFYDILQILWDSHGDDYVDVSDSNCKIILSIISWLTSLKGLSFIDKDIVDDMIDTFSVNL